VVSSVRRANVFGNYVSYHDSFTMVFASLDMAEFRQAFFRCVEAIQDVTDGQVVATCHLSHYSDQYFLQSFDHCTII